MVDLAILVGDLAAEHNELNRILCSLAVDSWALTTPAIGWTVAHQVAHLTFFDHAAITAIKNPEEFAALRKEANADPDNFANRVADPLVTRAVGDLLGSWQDASAEVVWTFRKAPRNARVPWFGSSMSLASMATGRLMETWAHGQDIRDTFNADAQPSERLRHIAHLAVQSRPYSYVNRGLPEPDVSVRVVLDPPGGGEPWVFGPMDARDVIRGSAQEFCLVMTRRRNVEDTSLMATTPLAQEWLEIGQTYAGPPGPGRQPGQFRRGQ